MLSASARQDIVLIIHPYALTNLKTGLYYVARVSATNTYGPRIQPGRNQIVTKVELSRDTLVNGAFPVISHFSLVCS